MTKLDENPMYFQKRLTSFESYSSENAFVWTGIKLFDTFLSTNFSVLIKFDDRFFKLLT